MWQRVWPSYLSLTHFDPTLIHSGSDDRRVDALVETCAVLTSHGLLDMGSGGTVQQQYLDATQYFKRKWTALQNDVPVVEDDLDVAVISALGALRPTETRAGLSNCHHRYRDLRDEFRG